MKITQAAPPKPTKEDKKKDEPTPEKKDDEPAPEKETENQESKEEEQEEGKEQVPEVKEPEEVKEDGVDMEQQTEPVETTNKSLQTSRRGSENVSYILCLFYV